MLRPSTKPTFVFRITLRFVLHPGSTSKLCGLFPVSEGTQRALTVLPIQGPPEQLRGGCLDTLCSLHPHLPEAGSACNIPIALLLSPTGVRCL